MGASQGTVVSSFLFTLFTFCIAVFHYYSYDYCWKIKSTLNNQSLVCQHLLERLNGTHLTEHSVETGGQVGEQAISLSTFLECTNLNIYFVHMCTCVEIPTQRNNWGALCGGQCQKE